MSATFNHTIIASLAFSDHQPRRPLCARVATTALDQHRTAVNVTD